MTPRDSAPEGHEGRSEADAELELERLAELVGEYIDRLNRGEPVDRAEVLEAHPELGERILERLELFQALEAELDRESSPSFSQLGDYEIRDEIGRGAFGIVYDAWQTSMGRRVALKVLPHSIAADSRAVTRFIREARIAGSLDHASIVPVYGTGVEADTPYYAMQYVDGWTISRLIARHCAPAREKEPAPDWIRPSSLDVEEVDAAYCFAVARTFASVADALQHAHERGVVHRDIKPSNLMLDRDGRLRVLDFGLARADHTDSLTRSRDVLGTPLYMSPEQVRARKVPIDHRTDVYSLGATIYEMITRQPPLRGRDTQDTLTRVLTAEPRPPCELERRIPKDLETIVLKCLRKEPAERYGTAEALAQDLRRFAKGDPIEARPETPLERFVRRVRKNRRRIVVTMILAVLVLVVGALGWRVAVDERRRTEAEYEDQVLAVVPELLFAELTLDLKNDRSSVLSFHGLLEYMPFHDAFPPTAELALEEVEEQLEELSALAPWRKDAWYYRARALAALDRRDDAARALSRALEIDPELLPARILLESLTGVEATAVELDPQNEWATAWRKALEASAEKRWDDAAAAFTELLRMDQADDAYLGARIEALLERAIAYMHLGDRARAVVDLSIARHIAPQALPPHLLLAWTHLNAERPDDAEKELLDLFERASNPDEVVLWATMLYRRFRHGDSRCITWIDRLSPGFPGRDRLRSVFRHIAGDLERAVEIAEEGLQREPEDPGLMAARAISLVTLLDRNGPGDRPHEELECSQADLLEAHRRAPTESAALVGLGWASLLAGDFDDARVWFDRELERVPQQSQARHFIGYVYYRMHMPRASEELRRRGVDLDPTFPGGRWGLGWSLLALDRLEEARSEFEESLRLGAGEVEVWAGLADLEQRAGNLRQAVRWYAQALLLDRESDALARSMAPVLRQAGPLGFMPDLHELGAALNGDRTQGDLAPPQRGILALLLARSDRPEDRGAALELCRTGTSSETVQDPEQLATLAAVLASNGDVLEAARTLQAAIRLPDASRGHARELATLVAGYPVLAGSSIEPALPDPAAADVTWAHERLQTDGVLRINCGAKNDTTIDGVVWSADRCYVSGSRSRPSWHRLNNETKRPLHAVWRRFDKKALHCRYRIPVPAGRYEVTLHFSELWYPEPGIRRFGVAVEGERRVDALEPRAVGFAEETIRNLDPVDVTDGILDIELLPDLAQPCIAAIEVQPAA